MKTRFLTISFHLLVVAVFLALGACAVFNQPRFGKLPQGDRLDLIQSSPNYRDGEFQYSIPAPVFSEDVGLISVIWSNHFTKNERLAPGAPVPAVKTNLKTLSLQKDMAVWLGHSTYYIQLDGKRILIDPVFSDHAAPFSFMNKAFDGTGIYMAEDMPEIDCLLISHDHWDHLDYPTVIALINKVKSVVCPLGVGAYFEHWGYPRESIHEADWFEKVELEKELTVHVLPARHYAGRLLKKNQTLWAGFALSTPTRNVFFSGDSGYGPHFSKIGQAFGSFDLAILDCGQYDQRWAFIHMTPEEAAQAAKDLRAQAMIPAHVGKFSIAKHSWDDPFIRIAEAGKGMDLRVLTPMIGESAYIDDHEQLFSRWWELDLSEVDRADKRCRSQLRSES
jgi:L-ascorbate metabolism protein UlaG (beta-lactamase superfamily)